MGKRYLDISSAHIRLRNHDRILNKSGFLFDGIPNCPYGYPYQYGSFVTVSSISEEGLKEIACQGFDEFADIIQYCQNNNISIIRFDVDAETFEHFKEFDL